MWLVKRDGAPAQRRDPTAATKAGTQWYNSGPMSHSYLQHWSEDRIQQLYTNVYLFACAKARASDLASLPIRVGADPEKPRDFDRRHSLARLLGPEPGGPAKRMSARRMIAWTLIQYDIMGRFAWEICPPVGSRTDGVPFELWPIPASRVKPMASDRGGEWFTHYEVATRNGPFHMPLDRMVYYWRPTQNDFRQPESLAQAAGINISIASMQDQYDHAFLVNDARPSFVVVHEEFERKSERKSFRRQFLDTHQGPSNAGKIAFAEASRDGASPGDSLLIHQLGLSQKDAEFIERYENQIRAMCVAMGVPLSRLADSSRRTYSNAEQEIKSYWRNSIKPAGVELAEAFNENLMPLLNDPNNVCWFDTSDVPELEPPFRFQIGEIPALLKSNAISVNEARTRMGLPERETQYDQLGLPEGANADGDPVSGPPERSLAALAALVDRGRSTIDAMRRQQLRAVQARAQGKRGRQTDDNGGTMAALYDVGYWFDQTEEMFRDLASQVLALSYTAGMTPLQLGSANSERWIRQWAGVLATHWVEHMYGSLQVFSARQGTADVRLPPEYDQVIHSMWRLAQSGEVVAAEQVALAAARMASGESLDSVVASLGT
jgi:HK97 family phage portal protein